jgi:hypothetical protein
MVRTRELDIANDDCARKRVPNRNAGIKRHVVMGGPDRKGNGDSMVTILAMRSMTGYAPGVIGTVTALFCGTIAVNPGVDWTLEAMIAAQQCEFFRRFPKKGKSLTHHLE